MASHYSWPYAPPSTPPPEPASGIALHDLSTDKRTRLWRWIQLNDAPFLAYLRSPEYALLRDTFKAVPVVSREYFDRAMAEVLA